MSSIEIDLPRGVVSFRAQSISYVDAPSEKVKLKKSEDDDEFDLKYALIIHMSNGNNATISYDDKEERDVEYVKIRDAI